MHLSEATLITVTRFCKESNFNLCRTVFVKLLFGVLHEVSERGCLHKALHEMLSSLHVVLHEGLYWVLLEVCQEMILQMLHQALC